MTPEHGRKEQIMLRMSNKFSGGGYSSLTDCMERMPIVWGFKSRKGGAAHV